MCTPTQPIVQGVLRKDDGHTSRRGSHTLKQLYCVLEGDRLVMYKDKKDAASVGGGGGCGGGWHSHC